MNPLEIRKNEGHRPLSWVVQEKRIEGIPKKALSPISLIIRALLEKFLPATSKADDKTDLRNQELDFKLCPLKTFSTLIFRLVPREGDYQLLPHKAVLRQEPFRIGPINVCHGEKLNTLWTSGQNKKPPDAPLGRASQWRVSKVTEEAMRHAVRLEGLEPPTF